ncbi:unnamed protein product [Triticum turgidum subsp. durum]|uniref:Uncharacterized protein n=1 Tax=Triticum turgidum subsp. durum TaxID=4567 RepID=A0A9R1RVF9_TRITD|nr:unnamed protein product [Triticum turgidum subsp. durum]
MSIPAKARVFQCKLKIREAFQNLLTVGKPEESMFDSEGNVSCDNVPIIGKKVFPEVAIVGRELIQNDVHDLPSDNSAEEHVKEKDNVDDLALLSEDSEDDDYYPEDPHLHKDIKEKKDESDFISYLKRTMGKKVKHVIMRQMNEFTLQTIGQKRHYGPTINQHAVRHIPWEACAELICRISSYQKKVFPEAAPVGRKPMQNDVHDLPSDNSEDDDFDPNISEEDVADHVVEHVKEKDNVDDLGLLSEDSDDDDYYPEDPDSDKDIKEKKDESNFTMDFERDNGIIKRGWGEGLDSDDSNYITSSDNNSENVNEKDNVDDLGLLCEGSEDDDYYPEDPDSDKDIKEKKDESNFPSDSKRDNGKESEVGSIVH